MHQGRLDSAVPWLAHFGLGSGKHFCSASQISRPSLSQFAMVSTSVRSPAASSGSKRRLKIGFTTPKFKPNRRSRSFPSCQETQNTRVQILGYVLQKKTLLNDLFLSKCMAASWARRVGRRGGTGGGQNCQMRVWCDVEWVPTAQRTGIDDSWVSHKTDFFVSLSSSS